MPPGGYHGQSLHVDLGSGSARRLPLDEATLRGFVGGSGLGTRLLLEHAPAGVGPLAPEAPVVVALSPLIGSAIAIE